MFPQLQNWMALWRPEAYHGRDRKGIFFEGWYFKLISADLNSRWAVIPGVYHHPDPEQRHAFIQILDGMTRRTYFIRYPFESFAASSSGLDLRIADNHFTREEMCLHVEEDQIRVQGELNFKELKPWPVRWFSPGVMGWYAFMPFMQTYHGILSFDHEISGRLRIDGQPVDFSAGRGYMEKDWGQTFPRAYIWMQSNHFPDLGTSISASIATIPWLSGWFPGFLVGLWHDGQLYRFTTYLGSQNTAIHLTDREIHWQILGSRRSNPEGRFSGYRLEILARRSEGGLIASPEISGMIARIEESLTASIQVRLQGRLREESSWIEIYAGEGGCAGLEVAGSVSELVDDDPS